MKTYSFWSSKIVQIKVGNGNRSFSLLRGSNVSYEDSLIEVDKCAKLIEDRISSNGKIVDYEVDIKEFVINKINTDNVVTVCRYGAVIWNTTKYSIYDLDDYRWEFLDLFRSYKGMSQKEIIVHKFKLNVSKCRELGDSFRIYETCKGVRVIGKRYIDPSSGAFQIMMRRLNVDWLYLIMCKRQMCYRARLSPKPFRMAIESIKIKSPLDCLSEKYKNWSNRYFSESEKYSVARLWESIGEDFSMDHEIVLHDKMTNSISGLKLA